ncbi:hypothetical protein O1611_g7161 [Lasiodiplodia mahajangana]|uniref:Uncharacterized protein n=1 Tax=Lasiodiplodia mahajangana TaxID=1108764 RepID=A0ACC2JGW1_9PEZI|nr:hypothetical protein O1611_g7161 [Lasiodiplodia mahajangana]
MMPGYHHSSGATPNQPVHLLPRYPAKASGGWDATPSHRRYPERHQRHQSQYTTTHGSREEDQVGPRSLPSWLPQETMNVKEKVNAWLIDTQSYTRAPDPISPVLALPAENNIPIPPVPSGLPRVVKKRKPLANILHKAVSKPNLHIPLQLKKAISRTSTSDSSLDSEMTCRGLPEAMIKREIPITTNMDPINDSVASPTRVTHGETITTFQGSLIIRQNESMQVTKFDADANDESLQRYKKSLGLGGGTDLSDPNDPRVCIIQSLTMESPGQPPVTIDLSQPGSENTLKDKPFKIKEGAKFTMVASFRVQHEILSGLQYVQTVKRKGIRVSKDSEMLGSYAPNTDKQPIYTKRFQEEDAPSGMLARGHYNAVSTFIDDDKKQHLQFEWSFDIAKDW